MPRRTRQLVVLLALGVTACSGGSAAPQPAGPVKVGVIAGNNQIVAAARSTRLPQDVVAQAVQLPSGQVGFRVQVIDALLPEKAYAQTAVTGVPNLVVCASAPDVKHALTAEVQCANTDALGKAYFVFRADTVAGVSKATVAAALPTGTKITDSVSATVMPGPVDPLMGLAGYSQQMGDTLPSRSVRDLYGNTLPFAIVSDSIITVAGKVAGTLDARRFTFAPPTAAIIPYYVTDIRGSDGSVIGKFCYHPGRNGTFDMIATTGLARAVCTYTKGVGQP